MLKKEIINEDDKMKKLHNLSIEIFGGSIGTGLGILIGGPLGAIAGAALTPILANTIRNVGSQVSQKYLAPREEARIGFVLSKSIDFIQENLRNGLKPRNDDFFQDKKLERAKAKELLEGILQKSQKEYQEKKLIYYSYLYANLIFDNSFSLSEANFLLKLLDDFSYNQLCLIALINKCDEINLKQGYNFQLENYREYNPSIIIKTDLRFEIIELVNKGLVLGIGGYADLALPPKKLRLLDFGKRMSSLMNLSTIPMKELVVLEKNIIQN